MRISDWSSDVCSSDLAARGTGKQRHAEFFFQFLDGPRQRRLFNMQLLRCASEAEFFGHSQKVSKVTKLHSDSYPVSRREAESIFSLDVACSCLAILHELLCLRTERRPKRKQERSVGKE